MLLRAFRARATCDASAREGARQHGAACRDLNEELRRRLARMMQAHAACDPDVRPCCSSERMLLR
jgi:hypothetical protein